MSPNAAEQTRAQDDLVAALLDRDAALAAEGRAESRVAQLGRQLEGLQSDLEESRALSDGAQETISSIEAERDDALATVAELESRIVDLEADLRAESATQPVPLAGTSSGFIANAPATSSGSGGPAYYANCSAARAAGAAPLNVGDAGYRTGLDRDRDGTACE